MARKRTLIHFGFLLAVLFANPGVLLGDIFSLPKSDKLLTFDVTVPGLKESTKKAPVHIRVTTREGTLFQVQDKSRSYWFGFIATLEKAGTVSLFQFGIESQGPKQQKATAPALTKRLTRGPSVAFLSGPDKAEIQVRYLGATNGSFPDSPAFLGTWDNDDREQMEALRLIYGDPSAVICCVGCGPIRVCADAIDIPGCGACGSGGGYGQI